MSFSLLALTLLFASSEPALTTDELIDRHLAARGGVEKIKAIRNLRFDRGSYSEGGQVLFDRADMTLARPYFKLVGDKRRPGHYLEGYDGSAWEWLGDPGVVVRTTTLPGRTPHANPTLAYLRALLAYRSVASAAVPSCRSAKVEARARRCSCRYRRTRWGTRDHPG